MQVRVVGESLQILVAFVGRVKKMSDIESSRVNIKVQLHQCLDSWVSVVPSLSLAFTSLSSNSWDCLRRLILMRCSCLCLRCLQCWPSKRRQDRGWARRVALLELFSVGEPHLWVSGPLDQFRVVYLIQNVEKTDWVVHRPSRCERRIQKFFVKETMSFVKDGPYNPSAHFCASGTPPCIYVGRFQHSEYFQQFLIIITFVPKHSPQESTECCNIQLNILIC